MRREYGAQTAFVRSCRRQRVASFHNVTIVAREPLLGIARPLVLIVTLGNQKVYPLYPALDQEFRAQIFEVYFSVNCDSTSLP